MEIERFFKSGFSALGASELLTGTVEALNGTTAAQALALREVLAINTVFDLAASELLHAVRRALAQPQPRLPGDVLDVAAAGEVALADAPLAALRSLGAAGAERLRTALGVATLGELAQWPPGLAARDLLAVVCTPEQAPGFDAEAPADLLPRLGEHATDKVFYRTLLIDSVAAPADGANGSAGTVAAETAGPIDLDPALGGATPFRKVATGALLSFSQSWLAQGLTLGQLLHSLSLAPGESTRMAMIDWSRQSRGRGSEAVDDSERLSNTTTHQRALSEVTEATATEVQTGRTRSTAESTTSQGGSALGFEIGPVAFGSSGGGSATGTEAMTASSSFGQRDMASSTAQRINDVSQQQASAARSRRASVVRELSQEEHETLSTRVIANYNHLHTLNLQYYEVVQAFRVTTRLERAERVVFVPVQLIDFDQPANITRFRADLAAAALDEATRQRIALAGHVLVRSRLPRRLLGLDGRFAATLSPVTATTAAGATVPAPAPATAAAPSALARRAGAGQLQRFTADGWDAEELRVLVRCGVRPIATRQETVLTLPADTLVNALSLPSDMALAIEVRRRDGSLVPLVEPDASGARFLAPEALRELASISLRSQLLVPKETSITLQLTLQGAVVPMGVPVTLQPGGPLSGLQRLVSFDPPPEQDELRLHLKANALHYTQAVLRTLDDSTLSALLARFSFGGVPLAQWVDHRPVAVSANYLVFKAALPDRGDPPDAALTGLTKTWQQFLATAGLLEAVPRRELIMLPTGGVFAEAVLGRSVAGEKLDSTRFFDWQESPIPLVASEIAPLEAGSRASDEALTPTNPSAPVINIQAPTALPDPTGLAAVLGAIGTRNLFNDLSGADATIKLAQAVQKVGAAGATSGGALAAQTLKTVMEQNTERLRTAAKVAAAMAGVPPVGAGGDGGKDGKAPNTVAGGLENRAKELDKAKAQGGGGAGGAGRIGNSRDAATSLQQRQSGAAAGETATRLLQSVAQNQQTGEAGFTATPQPATGPKRLTLEVRGTPPLADPAFATPATLSVQVLERDGTLVASRAGLRGDAGTALTVASSSDSLTVVVDVTYPLSWPQPHQVVLRRSATVVPTGLTRPARLDLDTQIEQQRQFVSAGPNPPDEAKVLQVLRAAAFDLDTILQQPVVQAEGGEFFARFPQLGVLQLTARND